LQARLEIGSNLNEPSLNLASISDGFETRLELGLMPEQAQGDELARARLVDCPVSGNTHDGMGRTGGQRVRLLVLATSPAGPQV
jgi:hypothetical protein